MHVYLGERMLASSAALAPLGAVAVQHHEHLDGSGYPRQLTGADITPAGRLLAPADSYQTLIEPRPYNEARNTTQAAGTLRAEVRAGRLDADATAAVLAAAGHRPAKRREWAAGLTTREVEILRLVARGQTNKQIAATLTISSKTAGTHVEHIYTKLGVTNRASRASSPPSKASSPPVPRRISRKSGEHPISRRTNFRSDEFMTYRLSASAHYP